MFSAAAGRFQLSYENGEIVSPTGRTYDVREAIRRLPWVSAVKYPPPHDYVTFEQCGVEDWEVLNFSILNHPDSYMAYFRGYLKPNRYWDHNGYRFWRTASAWAGKVTHMLNRALFIDAEPPRRVDEGAKPAHDWEGPPWEPHGSPWPSWYVQGADGKYRYVLDLDPFRRRRKS